MNDYERMAHQLRAAGYRVEAPPPPPPPRRCHWCERTEDDNLADGYGPLVDITVVTAEGEEGYAFERRLACHEHLESITEELVGLGFGNHRHGGINFLEDPRCYGVASRCPAPPGAAVERIDIVDEDVQWPDEPDLPDAARRDID